MTILTDLYELPPRHRSPWLRAALLALACGLLVGVGVARAEEEPRYEGSTRGGIRAVIAERAEANGVDAGPLVALAMCESRLDPGAVGDHGSSLGLMQLSTLPTGLYWHFLAAGYSDPFNAWEASDYVARVAAGAFPGIYLSRWSCAR